MIYFLLLFILVANSEKFCINCKHFKNSVLLNPFFGECKLYSKELDNKIEFLVSGFPKKENYLCLTARRDENMCGQTGKYYEKKCILIDKLLDDVNLDIFYENSSKKVE
jgi:hypothetical protein